MDTSTIVIIVGYGLLAISEILSLIPGMAQNGIIHALLVSMYAIGQNVVNKPPTSIAEALTEVVTNIHPVSLPPLQLLPIHNPQNLASKDPHAPA